jgi:hypothetical protein
MEIIIDTNLIPTLERLAGAQGKTPQEYASNILGSYLGAQYREAISSKIMAQPVADLTAVVDAVDTKLQEIAVARSIPVEVIEEATVVEEPVL